MIGGYIRTQDTGHQQQDSAVRIMGDEYSSSIFKLILFGMIKKSHPVIGNEDNLIHLMCCPLQQTAAVGDNSSIEVRKAM